MYVEITSPLKAVVSIRSTMMNESQRDYLHWNADLFFCVWGPDNNYVILPRIQTCDLSTFRRVLNNSSQGSQCLNNNKKYLLSHSLDTGFWITLIVIFS